MKDLKNRLLNLLSSLCQKILRQIDEYKQKEQLRKFGSTVLTAKQIDCSDTDAHGFCIQQIEKLHEKYSTKKTSNLKIIVVNGVLLSEYINNHLKDIADKEISDIAHSCLIYCQDGDEILEALKINCTEAGIKSLNEFFQGKGYICINDNK